VPALIAPNSDSLAAPYPDVVISCGRRAALVAMGLKTRAPKTRFIHIQDPQMPSRYFDLVVAMQHDKIEGVNVIKTQFALHAITPEVLARARLQFEPMFASYATPRVAVLLGGSTNKYQLDADAMQQVIASLQELLVGAQCSLLITPSRRTGEDNIKQLRQAFAGDSRVYIYDFAGENPYMGLLALADAIVVTNDSVNMMSEAHATGKPVYILPLAEHTNTKPARFAEMLMQNSIAKEIGISLEQWNYKTSDEMQRLAKEISQRFNG
jgi:mitochondrial fission protein ELM1